MPPTPPSGKMSVRPSLDPPFLLGMSGYTSSTASPGLSSLTPFMILKKLSLVNWLFFFPDSQIVKPEPSNTAYLTRRFWLFRVLWLHVTTALTLCCTLNVLVHLSDLYFRLSCCDRKPQSSTYSHSPVHLQKRQGFGRTAR